MQADEQVERYLLEHTSAVPPLLDELLAETERLTGRARWSAGAVEGRLLAMLVRLSGARRVVEIGTFTGFSALMMAEALPPGGRLLTCENDPRHAAIARAYFARSPHGDRIRLRLGAALDTLRDLPDAHADLVFIDADKPSYCAYYEEAVRIARPGGLIVADNVLWRGKVLRTGGGNANAAAIAAFNGRVRGDDRVEKVMLGLRDGVYLMRKA